MDKTRWAGGAPSSVMIDPDAVFQRLLMSSNKAEKYKKSTLFDIKSDFLSIGALPRMIGSLVQKL